MKKQAPLQDLTGSRVYLADFDRITYSQVAWTEEDIQGLIRHLERKLKSLLLVKGHVIIPASHLLDSDLAREILGSHPELFKSGAVVPLLPDNSSSACAYREKMLGAKKDVADFFQGEQVAEMAALLDENAQFIHHPARRGNRWFRERILADLSDPKSLIRLLYKERKLRLFKRTIEQIASHKQLDREDVYLIAKGTNNLQQWELLSNYADFVYYLGEALAVGSEGILPQENIMDFTSSALVSGRTRLSESHILTKVFVDTVKAVTSSHFPADFLDALRISDAVELHQIAVQSDFIAKYNAIQRAVKDGLALQDAERLVLTFEELGDMEQELYRQFEATLNRELPRKLMERRLAGATKALHTIGTLAIPFYGNLDAALDLILSAFHIAGKEQIAENITRRVQAGLDAFQHIVDRRKVADKPVLLDFIDHMKQRYREYLE